MLTFVSDDLLTCLRTYFSGPRSDLAYIVAPFINPSTLERVLDAWGTGPAVIISSWRPDYLVQGVASTSLYPTCVRHGWTLYINNRLHAKFFTRDLRTGWIGSANVTSSALDSTPTSNHEVLVSLNPLPSQARIWLFELITKSVLVNQELFKQYDDWLSEQPPAPAYEPTPVGNVDAGGSGSFLVSQLPASSYPELVCRVIRGETAGLSWEEMKAAEHDIAVYDLMGSTDPAMLSGHVREQFFEHPFVVRAAEKVTSDGVRFGALKEWIQKNCLDVPVPYRSELTEPTQRIFRWFVGLAPEEYEVIRPRHSEILRRRSG